MSVSHSGPRDILIAVVEALTWIGTAIVILGLAYGLTMFFWRPEQNIDRSRLGHWFRSLIRLYESDSLVEVCHRGSALRLTLRRRGGDGGRCWVVLSCPRASWMASDFEPVREAIAAEPGVLILPDTSGENAERLDVQVQVSDIWSEEAADVAVRIASRVLDALGVGADARFDLEFSGEQSMERSLEARKRQREGSLEEW
jgi:hypothetical protein